MKAAEKYRVAGSSIQAKINPPVGLAALWLFWGSLGLLFYTYLGFPLITVLRGVLLKKSIKPVMGMGLPAVSLVIAAYNEAEVIAAKLNNTFASDYPGSQLEVIVASDGSDDRTNQIVAGLGDPRVRLLALERQGKNRAINHAAQIASGEILVFTDADSMLDPDALKQLVAPFADPQVGGVGGSYHYLGNSTGGEGERTYWSFDRWLKILQSQAGNITGTTGHIYAIRRSLFRPVPPGVTDDAYISREVIRQHSRLVYAPQAIARGPIADQAGEVRRKVRVTTRGLKCVWEQRYLLNPTGYGFYAIQLFSHKVLRRLMAIPLLGLLISAPFLWSQGPVYRLAAIGQMAFHGVAALGYKLRATRWGRFKLLSLPYHLDMVNLATLAGVGNLLRGVQYDVWQAERAERDEIYFDTGEGD
jgi:cellulose synthase/poly-beta-1,6-N-acetylglucosamine synthase-like glycosyltransferase